MAKNNVYKISKRLKQTSKMKLMNNFSFIGLLIVVIIFSILTKGELLKLKNMVNIFNNIFSMGLLSMGVVFLMSLGSLDLSVGAIVGMSATIAAFSSNISTGLILPSAILVGLIVGSINGLIIAYLKVDSFIATLSMSFVLRGITTWMLNGTVGIPLKMRAFDQGSIKFLVFIIATVLLFILFERTGFGKHCRAIGSSEKAAFQSGVSVRRVRMITFMISGVMSGLVAFFILTRTLTASSKTGSGFEFDVLLAVLFGGMSLSGGWTVKFKAAIIGTISMAVLLNGMSLVGITGLQRQVVQGIILIFIVIITFDRRNVAVIK